MEELVVVLSSEGVMPIERERQDAVVHGAPARSEARVGIPEVLISTALWYYWARSALQQEAASMVERSAGRLMEETIASMVGVTSASFAIDGIYGTLLENGALRRSTDARHSTIFETIKLASAGLGSRTNVWPREFQQLFDLRDQAVHNTERSLPVEPHPSGVSSGSGNAMYTSETATWAVDLLLDVLDVCLTQLKPGPAATFFARKKPSVSELRTLRLLLRGDEETSH